LLEVSAFSVVIPQATSKKAHVFSFGLALKAVACRWRHVAAWRAAWEVGVTLLVSHGLSWIGALILRT